MNNIFVYIELENGAVADVSWPTSWASSSKP